RRYFSLLPAAVPHLWAERDLEFGSGERRMPGAHAALRSAASVRSDLPAADHIPDAGAAGDECIESCGGRGMLSQETFSSRRQVWRCAARAAGGGALH